MNPTDSNLQGYLMYQERQGQRKILIADDEQGIRQLLRDYFEMQDYQVIEAANENRGGGPD